MVALLSALQDGLHACVAYSHASFHHPQTLADCAPGAHSGAVRRGDAGRGSARRHPRAGGAVMQLAGAGPCAACQGLPPQAAAGLQSKPGAKPAFDATAAGLPGACRARTSPTSRPPPRWTTCARPWVSAFRCGGSYRRPCTLARLEWPVGGASMQHLLLMPSTCPSLSTSTAVPQFLGCHSHA